MPGHPITHLSSSVTACSTGPYGGICQLEPDKDAPTHPPGVCVYYRIFKCMGIMLQNAVSILGSTILVILLRTLLFFIVPMLY